MAIVCERSHDDDDDDDDDTPETMSDAELYQRAYALLDANDAEGDSCSSSSSSSSSRGGENEDRDASLLVKHFDNLSVFEEHRSTLQEEILSKGCSTPERGRLRRWRLARRLRRRKC